MTLTNIDAKCMRAMYRHWLALMQGYSVYAWALANINAGCVVIIYETLVVHGNSWNGLTLSKSMVVYDCRCR